MRAAHLLAEPENQSQAQSAHEPDTGSASLASAQYKVAADEGKASRGVSAGKALACAAVDCAPGPVRNIVCDAAKFRQIPGATRCAGVLHGCHQCKRDQRCNCQLKAPAPVDPCQHPPWQPDREHQGKHAHPRQSPCALVHDMHQKPVIAPGKSIAIAEGVCQQAVQSGRVPGYQADQRHERPQQKPRVVVAGRHRRKADGGVQRHARIVRGAT